MTRKKEYVSNKEFTSQEIAELVQGELSGPESLIVTGVATLVQATETQLSFLANDKYRDQVKDSKACVILVPENFTPSDTQKRAWIRCKDPSSAFTSVTLHYAPPPLVPQPGIHPSASVAESAIIGVAVHIGANAIVGNHAKIGDYSLVEAGCYIGAEVSVGCDCRFFPNVTLRERCVIGNRVMVHSGTVVGSDGFGYATDDKGHKKIPQVGIVQIDDDVEIGANVTIDRARFDRTWIKKGAKIDNLVQVGHNVVIGENTIIISQVGISGSVTIGKNVILAGQAGIPGHVTIGDGAVLMAKSGLLNDAHPGAYLMGIPAVPRKLFWKQTACLKKLPDLARKVKELESQVQELNRKIDSGVSTST